MKMNDLQQSADIANWAATLSTFFWKFMPAPLGAVVMVIFDMPKTRRELFMRLTVSYIASIVLGEAAFDLLHSLSWLSWLDIHNRKHYGAVEFLTAGGGWAILAAYATLQRKYVVDPLAAIADSKKVA